MKKARFVLAVVGPILILMLVRAASSSIVGKPSPVATPPKPAKTTARPFSEGPFSGTIKRLSVLPATVSLKYPLAVAVIDSDMLILDPWGDGGIIHVNLATKRQTSLRTALTNKGFTKRYDELGTSEVTHTFILKRSNDPASLQIRFSAKGSIEALSSFEAPQGISTILGLSPERFAANGLWATKLLEIDRLQGAHADTEAVHSAALFPEVVAPKVAINLHLNSIALNPRDHRIVQAFLYASRLHVYAPDGKLERAVAGPFDVKLSYDVVFSEAAHLDVFGPNADTRYSYIDVRADAEHIYTLFSGRLASYFKEDAPFGDQLHVFTWDGLFVGAWQLPDAVNRIAISHDGSRMWAARRLPTASIVEYDLSLPPLAPVSGTR